MKRRMILFVTLVGALCAPAHAQQSGGDWETGQVQIKCVRGHAGCTLTHENDGQGGGIQDLGGNGRVGGTDIDQLGGGNPPTTSGSTGNPPANTGDGNPVITPPDNGGDQPTESEVETAERLAREQQERVEAARERAENARTEREQKLAAQEMLRAENRMRTEVDRSLRKVRQASISSSANLKKALEVLKVWTDAMKKAGMTKELVGWLKDNKDSLDELVKAKDDIRWFVDKKLQFESLIDDYNAFSEDGTTLVSLKERVGNVENQAGDASDAKQRANIALIISGIVALLGIGKLLLSLFTGGGGSNTPKPKVTSVTPNSGPVTGGTIVTVKGLNLTATMLFQIDGKSARVAAYVGPDQVNIETPAGTSPGKADLVFGEPGSKGYVIKDAFEYIP